MQSPSAWVADVGNTRIAFLRIGGGELQGPALRLPATSLSHEFPQGAGLPLHLVSVNPRLRPEILVNLHRAGFGSITVWGEDQPIPVSHQYGGASRPGPDRLAAVHGAWRRCGRACVVVDAGTAITVDVGMADGTFAGGAIAPGLRALALGLGSLAPGLPRVAVPASPAEYPGTSTQACLELGLDAAARGMLEILVQRARAFAGHGAQVFVTGGDAEIVTRYVPSVEFERADDLVLEGVAAFAGLTD